MTDRDPTDTRPPEKERGLIKMLSSPTREDVKVLVLVPASLAVLLILTAIFYDPVAYNVAVLGFLIDLVLPLVTPAGPVS
mgnify:CR=1 FL=1